MELREAYRVLDLDEGASAEAARDARNLLAKVWHPDRHANDPALQKKAELKLAQINEAFDTLKAASFPAKPLEVPAAHARYAPPGASVAPPPPAAPVPPVATSTIELVPRRRVRLWVIALLALALAGGAYVAVTQLGREQRRQLDAGAVAVISRDAAMTDDAAMLPDAAPDVDAAVADDAPSTYRPPSTATTFGLGSSHDDVLAAQGQPTRRLTVVDEEWSYGFSIVTFNKRGKVAGWWDREDVLNVKLVPDDAAVAAAAKARGSYGMGATKDEVIGVQGTPKRITTVINEQWGYGTGSTLDFNGTGRITGYQNINGELAIGP